MGNKPTLPVLERREIALSGESGSTPVTLIPSLSNTNFDLFGSESANSRIFVHTLTSSAAGISGSLFVQGWSVSEQESVDIKLLHFDDFSLTWPVSITNWPCEGTEEAPTDEALRINCGFETPSGESVYKFTFENCPFEKFVIQMVTNPERKFFWNTNYSKGFTKDYDATSTLSYEFRWVASLQDWVLFLTLDTAIPPTLWTLNQKPIVILNNLEFIGGSGSEAMWTVQEDDDIVLVQTTGESDRYYSRYRIPMNGKSPSTIRINTMFYIDVNFAWMRLADTVTISKENWSPIVEDFSVFNQDQKLGCIVGPTETTFRVVAPMAHFMSLLLKWPNGSEYSLQMTSRYDSLLGRPFWEAHVPTSEVVPSLSRKQMQDLTRIYATNVPNPVSTILTQYCFLVNNLRHNERKDLFNTSSPHNSLCSYVIDPRWRMQTRLPTPMSFPDYRFYQINLAIALTGDLPSIIGHVRNLGFNAVQLMPFYDITDNPLDTLGYMSNSAASTDGTFGSELSIISIVDMFHRNGIAVALDLVMGQLRMDLWYRYDSVRGQPDYYLNRLKVEKFGQVFDYNTWPFNQYMHQTLEHVCDDLRMDTIRVDAINELRSMFGDAFLNSVVDIIHARGNNVVTEGFPVYRDLLLTQPDISQWYPGTEWFFSSVILDRENLGGENTFSTMINYIVSKGGIPGVTEWNAEPKGMNSVSYVLGSHDNVAQVTDTYWFEPKGLWTKWTFPSTEAFIPAWMGMAWGVLCSKTSLQLMFMGAEFFNSVAIPTTWQKLKNVSPEYRRFTKPFQNTVQRFNHLREVANLGSTEPTVIAYIAEDMVGCYKSGDCVVILNMSEKDLEDYSLPLQGVLEQYYVLGVTMTTTALPKSKLPQDADGVVMLSLPALSATVLGVAPVVEQENAIISTTPPYNWTPWIVVAIIIGVIILFALIWRTWRKRELLLRAQLLS
jgi:hypothetical protein